MITCRDLSCSNCSLECACSDKGLKKWLETEYGEKVNVKGYKEKSDDELESTAYKAGYEKGHEDGKNEVFSELSNIFKRK